MNIASINVKKEAILNYEQDVANRLACKVLDKPKPPLWMIFVPVFFLFFMQKMTQYKSGIRDFVENHLTARRRAMDMALDLTNRKASLTPADLEVLATRVPEHARAEYTRWMGIMIEHYMQLLDTPGNSLQTLIRSSYQSKTNFLLFCHSLNIAEKAYHQALLPGLEGELEDLRSVIDTMDNHLTDLRRQDADKFFS